MRMTRGYHDVNFRLVVKPSTPLTSKGIVPIDATAEDIQNEIDQGYSDGMDAVANWKARINGEVAPENGGSEDFIV